MIYLHTLAFESSVSVPDSEISFSSLKPHDPYSSNFFVSGGLLIFMIYFATAWSRVYCQFRVFLRKCMCDHKKNVKMREICLHQCMLNHHMLVSHLLITEHL